MPDASAAAALKTRRRVNDALVGLLWPIVCLRCPARALGDILDSRDAAENGTGRRFTPTGLHRANLPRTPHLPSPELPSPEWRWRISRSPCAEKIVNSRFVHLNAATKSVEHSNDARHMRNKDTHD